MDESVEPKHVEKQGYLAVAEKLQPPLYDETNKELRVLVEHRGHPALNADPRP
jgi:hypothetical protein